MSEQEKKALELFHATFKKLGEGLKEYRCSLDSSIQLLKSLKSSDMPNKKYQLSRAK